MATIDEKAINLEGLSTFKENVLDAEYAPHSVVTNLNTERDRAMTAESNLQTLYNNLQQSKPIPVTVLPTTGEEGNIYRLAGTTSYADYMWNGSQFIKMAEYNNAIDDEPIKESDNIVRSGGVYDNSEYIKSIFPQISNEQVEHIALSIESGYVNPNGELENTNHVHAAISVNKNETIIIKCKAGVDLRAYVFVIGQNVVSVFNQEAWNTSHNLNLRFTAPKQGTLYINSIDGNYIDAVKIVGYNNYESVGDKACQDGKIINWKVLELENDIPGAMVPDNKYIASITQNQEGTTFNYYKIEVKPKTLYKLFGYNIQLFPFFVLTDENNVILDKSKKTNVSSTDYVPEGSVIITPENAKYLYINTRTKQLNVYGTSGSISGTRKSVIVCEESEETIPLMEGHACGYRVTSNTYYREVFNADIYGSLLIPVSRGEKYFISSNNYYKVLGYLLINDEGTVIEDSRGSDPEPTERTWVHNAIDVKENGFLIISATDTWKAVYVSKVKNSCCFGKKWYVIGDSFTEFNPNRERNKVINYVQQTAGFLGLSYKNVGVGGTGYRAPSDNISVSYMNKALGCAGYDIVTVFGSFNDLSTYDISMPLGNVTDTTSDSLAGCMYITLNNIRKTNPNATIVVIAPAPWISQNSVTESQWGNINPDDYVDMIAKICKRYNICFVNPYSEGGACPWLWKNEGQIDYTYLYDDTHYNELGHKKFITPLVINGILKAFAQVDNLIEEILV